MKKPLIKFAVFCNRICGEVKKAESIKDLIENRMTKKQKQFWSEVKYYDAQGRVIQITREFLDEQGMTIEDVISDWITWGDLEGEIITL